MSLKTVFPEQTAAQSAVQRDNSLSVMSPESDTELPAESRSQVRIASDASIRIISASTTNELPSRLIDESTSNDPPVMLTSRESI